MPYIAYNNTGVADSRTENATETLRIRNDTKSAVEIPDMHTTEQSQACSYPIVKLDVDKVGDLVAARLSASLLGHVLFLKNQVPFPMMQLSRIPAGKTNTRATKQRTELMASFDTATSHLDTTFSALSTALARSSENTKRELATAYLAILVGPSMGSAKAKVILGIDGLEARVWGERDDLPSSKQGGDTASTTQNTDPESDDEDQDEEAEDSEQEGESEEGPEDSEDEDDGSEEDEDEDEDGDEDEDDEAGPQGGCEYISHAEEQKFLQQADRLLSRTLAAADAEGKGIISEMSPTQTHMLIRAPRRFNHPAWIPRQNMSTTLDSALQDFLQGSGLGSADATPCSQKKTKKHPLEGVWITARSGLRFPADGVDNITSGQEDGDEMIWWSWDGKLVGFADW